jgi:hypothetical protein
VDFSPEYVKMCEKAKEIQDNYIESEFWDLFYDSVDKRVKQCDDFKGGFIWLPRQDQLQAFITPEFYLIPLVENFYSFCFSVYRAECLHRTDIFHSMEQLWLAFVMKDKFNKTWTGEDWE